VRSYGRYCPVAHALDVLGERWSLLIVHELMDGPLRFTDLEDHLDGIGTNILSSRLKSLEQAGVVHKRKLPPPAASMVYELTAYGRAVEPVLRELAWWGIRTLGPPSADAEPPHGWLVHGLRVGLVANVGEASPTVVEFRAGEEVASVRLDGGAVVVEAGEAVAPDATVVGTARGYYALFVDRDFDAVEIEGDREALERLIRAVPEVEPVALAAAPRA
jgi:DNA-binding HxlR family transcriptional regulator